MTLTAKEEFQDVGQPLRILLAEDNAVNQKVAVSILTKAGHHVTLARDGAEAVREWNDSPFDLILMDIQMPKMDGLEATRNIRESEQTKGVHTPIVAVTAHVMTGDRNRCFEAGMDDYLSKPFRKHELLEVLNRSVRAGKKEVPEKIALERTAVTGVIDPVEILGRLEDDKELLCELIEIFLAEAKPELARIGDAVRDKDALALEQHAHKLKGGVAVFGAPTVVSAALALEEMGQAADLTRAGAGLARLERQLTELEEALSRLKQETCQGS